jgi:flagellar biosynthesis protein FlhB
LVSLGLADGAYVLLVTIGGVVLLAHESLQVQYSVKEIAPRLVVGVVASNLSFLLARQGIELANAASAALAGRQVDAANVTATIRTLALSPVGPGSLFTSLLVGALVVLAVVLAGTCLVRVMLVVFLVVAGPVMLAAHALPQTEGLARLWWRAMAACLGVQVAQALALVMVVRVFLEADRQDVLPLGGGHLVDVMVACCLLWLLIRIPAWAARAVVDGGRRSTVGRRVRSVVLVRTLRTLHVIGGS